MSEDYSHTPSPTDDRSDCEAPPYADLSLPYEEQPLPSSHEEQPSREEPSPTFYWKSLPLYEQPSPSARQSSSSTRHSTSPTEEDRLAATYQLGNVLKRYKSEPTAFTTDDFPSALYVNRRGRVAEARGLIPILFIITLMIWYVTHTPPWPLILICLLALAPWLSTFTGRLPADVIAALQNTEFYLCTNGLMIIKWTRVRALRWEQIQAIQRFRTHNVRLPYYILYPNEGKPITLHGSRVGEEIKELGGTIEREIRQHLLPAAIAEYEAGKALNFGSITVTAQGLTLEDEQQSLPWERFAAIEYSNEHSFTIDAIEVGASTSAWQKVEVDDMLNFCVFLPLITHIKNSLRTNTYEGDDPLIRETAAEETAQSDNPYSAFQERIPSQEEDLERERRAHEEILERLRNRHKVTPIPEEVLKALHILDLSADTSLDLLHQRYRQLAKSYHPDAGGDPETFKRISAAYQRVITWIASQDQGR